MYTDRLIAYMLPTVPTVPTVPPVPTVPTVPTVSSSGAEDPSAELRGCGPVVRRTGAAAGPAQKSGRRNPKKARPI